MKNSCPVQREGCQVKDRGLEAVKNRVVKNLSGVSVSLPF